MDSEKVIRREIKKYIDIADIKVVRMIYAMLEADADNDWWSAMPDKVKADVATAISESENGYVVPHSEIQKRYKKWIVK